MRTTRQQKQTNSSFSVNPKAAEKFTTVRKKGKPTTINMNSGSTLNIIESENSGMIRAIRKMMDNSAITDNDFRHYVRTMISQT